MPKVLILVVLVVIASVGGYYALTMNNETPNTPGATKIITTQKNTVTTKYENVTERTISIPQQNGSGESGSAVLTEKDGKVTVMLDITGAPMNVPQPAHIHTGACPNVGAVAYPLTNVVNGKSETVLDTTFAKLDAKEPLAINVHKSVAESGVYVACGNLRVATTTPAPTSMPSASPTSGPTSIPMPSVTLSPTPTILPI